MVTSAVLSPVVTEPTRSMISAPWAEHTPASPELTVRTSGGPTTINLFWDSLLEVSAAVRSAESELTAVRGDIAAVWTSMSSTAAHLHWRIPGFHARLGALGIGVSTLQTTLGEAVTGADRAHQAYRDADSAVQRWFHLLVRVSEHELILEHMIAPEGDAGLVYDWSTTTGVLTAGLVWDVAAWRYPAAAVSLEAVTAADRQAGPTRALMESHSHTLIETPAAELTAQGDGTLTTHMEHVSQVAQHGDIAVSEIDDGHGEPVYSVYIAGFDADGAETAQGRGPLSLIDAYANDSQHTAQVVEKALEEAGVPEGAVVVPIGYSLGGGHVMNLVNHDTFRQRYHVPAALTQGSPARNQRLDPNVAVTHMEDGRDPTPRLFGEVNQQSANRLTITYEAHSPEIELSSPLGNAHTQQHNIDAFRKVEQAAEEHLTAEEIEHLDKLRSPLEGQVKTAVFQTRWRTDQESAQKRDSELGSQQEPVQHRGDDRDHDRTQYSSEKIINGQRHGGP